LPVQVVFRKTSLVDYPGVVSSVIFFYGCNLRCPWCHNGELVRSAGTGDAGTFPLAQALAHIERRRKLLGGVVLSGGEPTLFSGLGETIARIKSLGLPVKLDTNGMRPGTLKALFADPQTRPDYIAMDLKLAPERYAELLPGTDGEKDVSGEFLKRSAALLRASGITHEFRTLALPTPYFGDSDLAALAPLAGDSPWHIRPFVPGNCLDPAWDSAAIP
jgi:pyruvate formate lyase activating enzyme